MFDLHNAVLTALAERPTQCLAINYVWEGYRPDQVHEVPEHLRGLVALYERVHDVEGFDVNGPRFKEACALQALVEAMVRDALKKPFGTGIGFYKDWKVLAVEPKDQLGYRAA